MISALINLDHQLLFWVTDWVRGSMGASGLAYLLAECLIMFIFLPLVFLWTSPRQLSHQHGNKKAVMLAVLSIVLSLALKAVVTGFYVRTRPFIPYPAVLQFPIQVDPASFPSMHTMLAFTVAGSIYFSGMKKMGSLLLFLALLVGAGRVMVGVHYPSDVLGGAIFGLFVAWMLHRESSSIKQYLPN